MSEWPIRAVKQVAEVKLGKMVRPGPRSDSDVEAPYLRAAHIQPQGRLIDVDDKTMWFSQTELRDLDIRSGDVVVVEGGAGFGRSAYVTENREGWGFQNSIVRVRPRSASSDGRFLNYVFQSLLVSGRTGLEASVATIPHYTAEKVAATMHPFPTVERQRAIADFLDREAAQINAMIEAQKALIGELQERRRAAITTAVDSDESIPRVSLRHLVTAISQGWSPQCEDTPVGDPSSEWSVLKVGCVNGGVFRAAQNKGLPGDLDPRPELGLRAGDLLMSRGNTRELVGSAAIVDQDYPALMLSDLLYRVALDRSLVSSEYVALALSTRRARDEIEIAAKGTSHSMQKISQGDIRSTTIPLRTLRAQAAVVAEVKAVTSRTDAMIAAAREVIDLLRERREALIAAAVTGRIDPATGVEEDAA